MSTKLTHQPVDLSLVREFCDIAETHDLVDLDVSYGEFRLRVSRSAPVAAAVAMVAAPAAPLAVPASPAAAPVAAPSEDSRHVAVRSPLAGVFYRAPRPGSPPFVSEGEEVKPGQCLCIIEAMKMMNSIDAEMRARVHRILVENAQVVEAGQELFLLEPV